MSVGIIIFLGIFSIIATRRLQKVPGRLQALLEIIVEGLENFVKSQMGRVAGPFIPFIGTLFIYIFIMNMLGQYPIPFTYKQFQHNHRLNVNSLFCYTLPGN